MASQKHFDVIIIGGGASGMMAACRARETGADVLLLEKNESLGKKLLISGGGRCNVTNAEPDKRTLLDKFKEAAPHLFSPFSQWDNHSTISFFESHGMKTKIENEGRVFPASDSAQSVWDVLKKELDRLKVIIKYNAQVTSISQHEEGIFVVVLKDGVNYIAKNIIMATGGKSRPETGSTGDGFQFLKKMGHTIIEPTASLVPVVIRDSWVRALMGVTLEKVRITVVQNNQKQFAKVGKLLFTHFGITGPTILNMSKDISEQLKYGPVDVVLDLFPGVDLGTLNNNLTTLFHTASNKQIKNVLDEIVPAKLVAKIISESRIAEITPCHSVTREQRMAIIHTVKNLSMRVTGLLGTDKAIITSGGVPLSEINTKTMESTIVPGMYIIGDLLDIDRPSGGYSLQLCWTTGFVAGSTIKKLA